MLTTPHPDLRHPSWGDPLWPEKFHAFRPAQIMAIQEIITHFDAGAKVVVLDAPTGCLSGDTLIDCPRDLTCYPRGIPIRDLVGRRFLTYTWDAAAHAVTLRWADNVHQTGVKTVYRVALAPAIGWRQTTAEQEKAVRRLRAEGKEYIEIARLLGLRRTTVRGICVRLSRRSGKHGRHVMNYPRYWPPMELTGTEDHPVMLTTGVWRHLGELQPGDRLMSLYRCEDERTHIRWTGARKVSEQQFVCEQMHGPRPVGAHAHHGNENPYDHTPDNLIWKDASRHAGDHLAKANRRGTRGWKKTGKHPRGMAGKQHSTETKLRISAASLKMWAQDDGTLLRRVQQSAALMSSPQAQAKRVATRRAQGTSEKALAAYRSNAIKARAAYHQKVDNANHVVIGRPELCGLAPVYDMTVEETGNFVANGVVVHNSGKTAVGEAVRRLLAVPGVYVCTDRVLQDQVLRDFPYAKVLKGRSNYPTLNFPERHQTPTWQDELSADDCDLSPIGDGPQRACSYCTPWTHCPYRLAKTAALAGPLSVLNTAYLLAEANQVGGFSGLKFGIADEADRLESTLRSATEAKISGRRIREWGLHLPRELVTDTAVADWLDDEALPHIEKELDRFDPDDTDVVRRRAFRQLTAVYDRVRDSLTDLREGRAVCEIADGVTLKPVTVDHLAPAKIWAHAQRWLLMSATVLGAESMLKDLGVTEKYAVVHMPSAFPLENRPVYVTPVARVVRANEEPAANALAKGINRLMVRYPEDRILVHTATYRLAALLQDRLGVHPRTLWIRSAAEKAAVLQDYLANPAAVLIAPALERGVDLPDEACRVVIWAKVPWADLGDRQVLARIKLSDGQFWYGRQAMQTLIQGCGRGVRHEGDWAHAFILDESFLSLLRNYWSTIPKWFQDAIVMNAEV